MNNKIQKLINDCKELREDTLKFSNVIFTGIDGLNAEESEKAYNSITKQGEEVIL
jgi:hypothetical protein